jgi:hypothetical protein
MVLGCYHTNTNFLNEYHTMVLVLVWYTSHMINLTVKGNSMHNPGAWDHLFAIALKLPTPRRKIHIVNVYYCIFRQLRAKHGVLRT